jgi:hypothetical protein
MQNKNQQYLKKVQFYKQLSQPLINLLDQTRLLPLFVPLINYSLRKAGIKRQFQRDLNYRLIGKAFKNSLKAKGNESKTLVVPFLTSGNNIFLLINFLIAYRLRDKGYRTVFLICDKSLPVCNNERIFKTRNEDKFTCSNCFDSYAFLKKVTGAEIKYLSQYQPDYQPPQLLKELEQINTIEACRKFVYNDIPFGMIAEKSVLRFFYSGELEDRPEQISIYKKFIVSLIGFASSWEQLAANYQPDLILMYNGTLSFESYIRYRAQQQQMKYVTHETYVGKDSWIYKVNDEVMKLKWEEQWNNFSSRQLTEDEERKAIDFIEGLRGGKQMYAVLNQKTPLDERLKGKPFVALFTNLNFDTAVLGRNPVFASMHEWISAVIDFWIENDIPTTLVIRVHPAELKLITAANDYVAPKIKDKIRNAPNIILFDASDKVDSYTLIEHMEFGLIYSSTIGMEIAYMNKPCLLAGDGFYKDKSFVMYKENKNDYFSQLSQWLTNPSAFAINRSELLKFIYFIYFVRVKRLKGVEMDHANHVNTFRFETAEELLQMNREVIDEFIAELNC